MLNSARSRVTLLMVVLLGLAAWQLTNSPASRPEQARAPTHPGPVVVPGHSDAGGADAPRLPQATIAAAAPAAPSVQRNYRTLSRDFPGGLQTEAQLALRAGNAKRSLEVAKELGKCLHFQQTRAEFERLGLHHKLDQLFPTQDPGERARLDAFCQTAGPNGQVWMEKLLLLAASQALPEAVYWAHEDKMDPTGASSRLIGRWALQGNDLLALGTVMLDATPDVFGLSEEDLNVVRKASALLLDTPEYAARLGFKGMLTNAQESATFQRAGVSSWRAYEALPAGKPPLVKFAELSLSPADEQRVRDIVNALVEARRRQLAGAGG